MLVFYNQYNMYIKLFDIQDLLHSAAEGGCTDIIIKLLDDVKMNVNMVDVVSLHGCTISIYLVLMINFNCTIVDINLMT